MYPFKLSSTVHLSLEIDGNPLHNLTKHAFRVCVHVINETHLNLHVFLLGTMLLQPLTGFILFAFILGISLVLVGHLHQPFPIFINVYYSRNISHLFKYVMAKKFTLLLCLHC